VCSDKVCRRISQPSAVGTAGLCSRMVRHRTRLEHHHVSAASECHLHRTGHVANQQPGLKPSRLCHSVGGGLQERLYHDRKFENVEAIMREWRAPSQRFIDGSINQWRRRLSYRRMVDILNTRSASCRHHCCLLHTL